MTIQTFASGIQTGTASEVFVSSPNIAGQFRMYLDTSNMTTGTYTEVRRYKMVASGGTARVIDVTPIQGLQPVDKQIYESEIIFNDLAETNGCRFSLKQPLGTAVTFTWSVVYEDPVSPTIAGSKLNVTGTKVDVSDKTGFSLSSPQSFNLIGNISGTLTNVLNVINPVTAGNVTGSVLGNVNGSVNSVVQPVGISTGTFLDALADKVWDELLSGHLTPGSAGHTLFSRMPTGTVLVGDKTGFYLGSPQTFDMIGNITGTLSMVLNVQNPVTAGNVTGSVFGNVNGSVNSVVQPVGILTGSFIFAIADQVWDETLANHLLVGSTGEKLYEITGSSGGGGSDPWLTLLPASYTPGQAG